MPAAACCLALLAGCAQPAAPPGAPELLRLHTDAGQRFEALFYATEQPQPPAVVLVPGQGRAPEVWEPLARRLQREGYMLLALEPPAAGEPPLELLPQLDAARDALWERGADLDNFVVAGEELGANLVLHHALADPAVQAVVLIAPGIEYQGVRSLEVVEQLDTLPILVLAAEGDAYAASSAQAIKDTAPVYSELRTFSGAALGADIFTTAPTSLDQTVQWLKTVLGR